LPPFARQLSLIETCDNRQEIAERRERDVRASDSQRMFRVDRTMRQLRITAKCSARPSADEIVNYGIATPATPRQTD
jgi:hypothetical protein